jgi:hypothetical protein
MTLQMFCFYLLIFYQLVLSIATLSICSTLGQVIKPLDDAVVIHILIGHNQPITEMIIPSSLDIMLTVSRDNTVKVCVVKFINLL